MFKQTLEDKGVGQTELGGEHSRKGTSQHRGPEADALPYSE